MSSLTEKVLMIGFGATICLSLFSAITPLLSQLQLESGTSSFNSDILNFYQMITEINRKSEEAIQFPAQDFRIHIDFSLANSIHFSKSNNSTLNVVMELENQRFFKIIEFDRNITIWLQDNEEVVEFFSWTETEDRDSSIEIIFEIIQLNGILYFKI